MENSRCKAFIECVNCGSIKAAADLMGYTPSAVSQLITAGTQAFCPDTEGRRAYE